MNYNEIIFDLDGTLWDSRIPVIHSWNNTVSEYYGRPSEHSFEELSMLFGKTMDVIRKTLFPDQNEDEQIRMGNICFEQENEWLQKEQGKLLPEVRETLISLYKKYPLYIVSNCQTGYIDVMLKTMKLKQYFSGYMCYGETCAPKSETIRQTVKKYHIQNPVYVGDTQLDADACKAAGIPFIFASYGFGNVKSEDCLEILNSFGELKKLFL